MKFFADENIAAQVVQQLRALGHDVAYPPEAGATATDDLWLERARVEQRVLITDDKDLGELVVRRQLVTAGVVLLRLHRLPLKQRLDWLQARWQAILQNASGRFVVVTETKIRIRSPRA